ncbi:MAG TPA: hypothetical protein VIV54_06410 [Burkholderiales bacterium]
MTCNIAIEDRWLRATVGPGLADEVQKCYRAVVNTCLTQQCSRVLVVGKAGIDAFAHLAGRDALHAMALAGVAKDFRLGLVAETPDLIAIYDSAVLEAERLGMAARRFRTVEEAEQWLRSEP